MRCLSRRRRRLWIFSDMYEIATEHSPIPLNHFQWWHLYVRYNRIREMRARCGPFLSAHGLGWLVNKPTIVMVSCTRTHTAGSQSNGLTFISALESSPVHCLKPRPWGNRRRPANGGASAILFRALVIWIKNDKNSDAYRWSISSSISFDFFFPWVFSR